MVGVGGEVGYIEIWIFIYFFFSVFNIYRVDFWFYIWRKIGLICFDYVVMVLNSFFVGFNVYLFCRKVLCVCVFVCKAKRWKEKENYGKIVRLLRGRNVLLG